MAHLPSLLILSMVGHYQRNLRFNHLTKFPQSSLKSLVKGNFAEISLSNDMMLNYSNDVSKCKIKLHLRTVSDFVIIINPIILCPMKAEIN